MADLDDFFAKRDKKKPKGKKFESTDDVAKILETKAKERKKMETFKSQYTAPLTEDGLPAPPTNDYRAQGDEDDEWKEAVEEKPDYTGLKIGELVLLDDDDETDANENDGREGVEGQSNDGPWSKHKARRQKKEEAEEEKDNPTTTEASESIDTDATDPITGKEDIEMTTNEDPVPTFSDGETTTSEAPKGAYVPPSRRGVEAASAPSPKTLPQVIEGVQTPKSTAPPGAYVPPSRRGLGTSGPASSTKPKKATAAPNMDDTSSFPSLGGS